jgi:endoglucanase
VEGDQVLPTGHGGGGGSAQYGADAQRLPLWFAGAACDLRARRLAGAWWTVLQEDDRSSALALSTTGQTVDGSPSVLALLASAASARAAGDTEGADELLKGARQVGASHPTYYGTAWLALSEDLPAGDPAGC